MPDPSSSDLPPAYSPTGPDGGDPPAPAADYPYPDHAPPYPPLPPFPYPYGGPQPYVAPRTNTLAILSLISAFVCMPLGVVFGHVSLSQIKRTGEQGRGMAIAGLVVGYLLTAAAVVMLVLALILAGLARDAINSDFRLDGGYAAPATAERTLPDFVPPAGLGAACSYPATTTDPARAVTPPRSGKVATDPAIIDARITLNGDPIGLHLDNAQTPCTVNSFVSLARQGFFDNTPCHRLTTEPSLGVLQCGDPTGTGIGGPGYRFDNEYPTNQYRRLDPALSIPVRYPRGTLASANSGPDSNGSQFFIIYRDSMLPPTYTVFGHVDDADLPMLDELVSGGVKDGGDDGPPATPVTISSVVLK